MRTRPIPARGVRRRRAAAVAAAALLLTLAAACGSDPPAETAAPSACGTPERVGRLPAELSESSGLAVSRSRDVLWTHNDSGSEPVLYAIAASGEVLQRVVVAGSGNEDWEDITLGSCDTGDCLYIADIGDNRELRDDIAIYRVPEPAAGDSATRPADRFPIRYPDGAQDAESVFMLPSGELFVVTKGRSAPPAVYRYPPPLRPDETVALQRILTLGDETPIMLDQVTATATDPAGGFLALRTYVDLRLHRLEDGRPAPSEPIRVSLAPLAEPQGEGVALRADGTVLLTSEAGPGGGAGLVSEVGCTL